MPAELIDPRKYMKGEVRLHKVDPLLIKWGVATNGAVPDSLELDGLVRNLQPNGLPEGWNPLTGFMHNDFLYEWGAIFGSLLCRKGLNYGIGGMYVEYENVGTPGDPVSAPAFTRDAEEGVDYYNGLSGSADRDYLRVPLVSAGLSSSDQTKFPKGNLATFFAQTSGVAGVHGKPFSDANNSTVFGGALVAFVDEADHTRDLILSRFYVSTGKQQPKLSTSQVGFEWRLTLG